LPCSPRTPPGPGAPPHWRSGARPGVILPANAQAPTDPQAGCPDAQTTGSLPALPGSSPDAQPRQRCALPSIPIVAAKDGAGSVTGGSSWDGDALMQDSVGSTSRRGKSSRVDDYRDTPSCLTCRSALQGSVGVAVAFAVSRQTSLRHRHHMPDGSPFGQRLESGVDIFQWPG